MPENSRTVTLRLTGETPGSTDGHRMKAVYYDILADGHRVGTCELRLETTWTTRLGGQVSYTVFPQYRGHRYALQALRLLSGIALEHGVSSLTVTCRPENRASRRTLELAGAVLTETAAVPPDHPLYASGVRRICIYRMEYAKPVCDSMTEVEREE